MKKFLLFVILLAPIYGFSQKNEIVTYFGKSIQQITFKYADTYQLKFERSISRSVNIQVGFRCHDELEWKKGILNPSSNVSIIRKTFNSYKFDASVLFIPINSEFFKLKIGLGLDGGKSFYAYASKGIGGNVEKPEGIVFDEYWQYTVQDIPDFGIHFIISGNYYFKNNLFCSIQAIYNQIFNEYEFIPNNRVSPLCLSIGIGHRF